MAGQKFTLSFDAQLNVGQMKGAINNIQGELNKLQLPSNLTTGFTSTLSKLEKEIRNFEIAATKDLSDKGNFNALERSAEKISSLFEDIKIQGRDLGKNIDVEKLFPASIASNIKVATQAIAEYEKEVGNLKSKIESATNTLNTWKDKLAVRQTNRDVKKQNLDELNEVTISDLAKDNGVKQTINSYEELTAAIKKAQQAKAEYDQNVANGSRKANTITERGLENSIKKLEATDAAYKKLKESIKSAKSELSSSQGKVTEANNKIAELAQTLERLKKEDTVGQENALTKLFDTLNKNGVDVSQYNRNIEGAQAALENYAATARNNATNSVNSFNQAIEQENAVIEENTNAVHRDSEVHRQFDDQVRDVSAFKSRIQYFFGLTNTVNLFKRAIREAFNTIKDLDKAMTETAVVTNFTVSDMWAQLPEYTKRANELGVTTQAAYESATLFYQQGLNTKQAAELSTETLKMARIAGLDAAEATDRMTNALRGFNMELDATAAQRVDDVYSQLAAHTASNVDEISTAMTKVASLAHSANMEFETTAAFLAQIIETTRESAETAGTALKTVVARFSEVKKLYSEDQLKGTDEEGQVIDVNKISVALRTAGIDLNKYFLGEVGLDDIFIELASKWDSLTSVQQRYIATQAAGSRQQSRFIALMQDYARTQELVGMAYEANGASARQFEKTQDSLQSKLARLKNAWNEFLMGLTNNVVVKSAVDALTNLLNLVNKITSAFGNGVGSILKWVAALSAMRGVGAMFKNGGIIDKVLVNTLGNTILGRALTTAGVITNETNAPIGNVGAGSQTQSSTRVGPLGLFSGLKGNIQKFISSNAGDASAYQAYLQMASEEAALGNVNAYQQELNYYRPTNSIFGALGKKFGNTKIGGTIATKLGAGLGKIGIGTGAAVSGSAALAVSLGAVTAAAVAAAAAIKAVYDASPEGQLKNAQKLADAMSEISNKATQVSSNFKDAQNKLSEYNQAVGDASTLNEKTNAIDERNKYIQSLIDQDSKYAQFLHSKVEGGQLVLTIGEEGFAKAAEEAANAAQKISIGATLAQASVAGRQANIYENKIAAAGVDLENRTIRETDESGETYQRRMTNDEYAKYAKFAVDASVENTKMRQYAENAYAQLIDAEALGDELANELASAFAQNFDESDLETANWSFLRSRGYWSNQYLQLYGIEADKEMKTADIARAVKQGEQTQEKSEQLSKATELLTGKDSEFYRTALDAFSGIGESANLNFNEIGEATTAEDIFAALGLDVNDALFDTKLANLASALDTNIVALKTNVVEQAKANKELVKKNKATLYQQAFDTGVPLTSDIINQIASLTPRITQLISDITSQAIDVMSSKDFAELMPQLFEFDEEQLSQYYDFFDQLNLDNPIQALQFLNETIADLDDGPFKSMVSSIKEANSALFDTGNLVQSFLLSESYEGISESISDLIEKNERLSGKNIEELAESCSDLQAILDETTVTAEGLAEAFNLFESAKAPIDAITSALLAALSAGESFESLIDKVSNWIEDFNEGTDLSEGTEHIIEVLDKAAEYVSDWQFGNEPLENIYNHIFGDNAYGSYMAQNWGRQTYAEIEKTLTENLDKVKKWAENEGVGALEFLATKNIGIKNLGEGKFSWNLSQFENTSDAIDKVASSLGVTNDAARAFIESWGSHMWDLRQDWNELNLKGELEGFATSLGENATITEAELIALGAATGKSADEVMTALTDVIDKINETRDAATAIEIPIRVNWQGEDGGNLTGEDLIFQFGTQLGLNRKANTSQPYTIAPKGNLSTDPALWTPVNNPDGSYSTVNTITIGEDGKSVLIPTVINKNGQRTVVSNAEAEEYYKQTGLNFGKFNTEKEAGAYAEALHQAHADYWATSWDYSDFVTNFTNELGNGLDAARLNDHLVNSLKLTPDQAEQVADDIAQQTGQSLTQEITIPVKTELEDGTFKVDRETITVAGDTSEELRQNVELALSEANAKVVGENLASENYEGLQGKVQSAIEAAGELGAASVQTSLANQDYSIEISWSWANGTPGVSTGGWANRASGGIIKSYAQGSENFHVQPGTALTGEEGPELIWNKNGGYAYVTGKDGPEFQNLQPGDRIFNASETKRIFKNSEGKIKSFAKGGEIFPAYDAGGGWKDDANKDAVAGADKEKTPEEWKNELDWLYNLMEDIVELERDQKKLEEKYEDYLVDQSKTGKDLYNLLIQQLGNLYTQLNHQTYALEKREQEMREFMDTTNDKDEYLWYNWQDRTLEIDWDGIEALQDEEEYKHIKELVDEAESIQDKMDDAEDAIIDINNQIQELENIWRDTFVEFENRVLDAVVKSYQQIIDNYSELNDTLNDTNSAILQSIQKEISLQRQIRDNTKTEEELTDEEARLAYLRRDTTGGNDLASLQLEKSLDENRQKYEDTLVDQAVQRLQDDNEAAQQQREKQIEIMQAQLDYQSENGEFNAYVRELLTTAMDTNGKLLNDSNLMELLKEQENWSAMSDVEQAIWEEELNGDFMKVAAFLLKQNAEENGTYVTALTAAINGISTTIGSYSQALTKMKDGSGSSGGGGGGGGNTGQQNQTSIDWTAKDVQELYNAQQRLEEQNKTLMTSGDSSHALSGNITQTQAEIDALIKRRKNAQNPSNQARNLEKQYGYNKSFGFATGGLTSATGLAWLDGTVSEPEYVLNARQTEAFLKLADVLPAAMNGNTNISNSYGNSNFNVVVNVDKIDSDYSVDRMVDRIKDQLYEDATYRNVNTLNFLR